ncbi:cyanophycinase [Granulicella tundricola]|uniref:Cyanophycinase n=1 Tax=Granulicella tundricola (strain ATCC BAA-1859 / DSM 23138 / MP5ACTX9) TaxID=1198114 RepID=E8X2X0_GRATM|nr:Type 1 glutamine amidotransferase-like domain-containing protein [Granulicella tundricola]ADW68104.1 cyanophycinase [Granulicella tundricola MP5ACTX9]
MSFGWMSGMVRLSFVCSGLMASAALGQVPSHGPAKGSLLVTGGATEARDYQRLVEMAGGAKAKIVVIPNASVTKPTEQAVLQEEYCGAKSPFAAFPGAPCTVLYTNDKAVANTAAFVAPLKTATGVWFVGGRHWRIADAYLDTLTLKEFFGVLERGGVVGGGSAGATIQGSYMVRGSAVPDDNTIMMAPGHEIGFGFMTNVTFDQHVDVRHRENDMAVVIKAHPDLLCFGLDQATSITVHGDTVTVNGPKRVAVWDGKDHDGKGYYHLRTGDKLNTVTRVATVVAHPGE